MADTLTVAPPVVEPHGSAPLRPSRDDGTGALLVEDPFVETGGQHPQHLEASIRGG